MRSNCQTGIKISDIILTYPSLFAADGFIWLIAHKLPLLIVLAIRKYFSGSGQTYMLLPTIIVLMLTSMRIVMIRIGAKIDIRCQQLWFRHLSTFIYASIVDNRPEIEESDFVDGINNDISSIVSTISYGIDTVCNVLYSLFAVCILLSVDARLTLLILIFPVLSFFVSVALKRKVMCFTDQLKYSENEFSHIIVKLLTDNRLVHIEAREREMGEYISTIISKQEENGRKQAVCLNILKALTSTLSELSLIVILVYTLFVPEILFSGNIILVVSYTSDISGAAQYINSLILVYYQCTSYLKDFNAKYCANKCQVPAYVSVDTVRSLIDHIANGKVNVLIGPNGSGKSNFLGFLYTYLGNAVLLKPPVNLLNLSIKENICASDYEVAQVFNSVVEGVALSKSEFSDGYNTIVAPKEVNISGGQAFRIALARTIYAAMTYSNCEYILVDDNLLSVDADMRSRILDYMKKAHKTFIITDQENRELYDECNCIHLKQLSQYKPCSAA